MTDQEYIKTMMGLGEMLDHPPDGDCGMCHHNFIWADVGKQALEAGWTKEQYQDEVTRRWHASKFVKLYQDALKAGLDPEAEFEKKGWEM